MTTSMAIPARSCSALPAVRSVRCGYRRHDVPPYGSPEWLEGIQTLVVVGWLLLAGGVIADTILWARSRALRKPAYELCKLHQRPIGECRDQHDAD